MSYYLHFYQKCLRSLVPLPYCQCFKFQSFFCVCVIVPNYSFNLLLYECILSCFSCVWLYATLWTVARQAPLSMGILQARILDWVAMPYSRGSSWCRDQIHVSYISCTARWVLYHEYQLGSPICFCLKIQPVHSEGDQPWDFFGRNDAKAETPVLWPLHVKSWLIGKDSDAGRDWGQEKGTTEDEMAGWHHWLDGCESEWTPGVGDGQGGLVFCDSWGCKKSGHDWATELNWMINNVSHPLVFLLGFHISYFV